MTVILLGVNHRTATTDLREQLSVPDDAIPGLLSSLPDAVSECVLLCTCNRTELYAVADGDVTFGLVRCLSEYSGVPASEVDSHSYVLEGRDAVHHLMSVAGGLDSVVIGEPQILGQVRRSWEIARAAGATGPVLNTLFRFALEAGKEVRSRTPIARGALSVAHAAVEIARMELHDLSGREVLVLGAGETGRAAAMNLLAAGVGRLMIANRTLARAEALAERLGGSAVPLAEMPSALSRASVLITCAASREPIVPVALLERAVRERKEPEPLLVIDVAVPRNVEAAARYVPGVSLFDMDDVQRLCEANRHARAMAARGAERNIAEWTDRFVRWQRERGAVPSVRRLRARGHAVRDEEVEKALRRLPGLSERERNVVRAMGHAIANRLLHEPTVWLKRSEDGRRDWVESMWGLD